MRGKKAKKSGKKHFLWLLLLIIALFVFWIYNAGAIVPERSPDQAFVNDHSVNILIAGSDINEALGITGRADTIIAANVDLQQKEIFFLSIPRDTLVEISGYGLDKINHAFAYGGMELLIETVEGLLGIPIDYSVMLDFAGFKEIVDIIGGVEIEVDKRMYYQTYDGLIDIEAGFQRLNGEKALQYVRYRQDELGDITRVSRQQTFLKAVVNQLMDAGPVKKMPQLFGVLDKHMTTDLKVLHILRLGFAIRGLSGENLSGATLPGDFLDQNGVSYWQHNQEATDRLLEEHFGD